MQQTVALVSLVLTAVHGEGTTTVESLGDRSFLLHLPSGYGEADETFPLVLNLHGYSSNMHDQAAFSNMNDHADQNAYIAVYPQGKSLGSVDISDMNISLSVDLGVSVMNLTYWNDLALSGSPGPLGPTCNGEDDSPLGSIITSKLPAECQDVLGCNAADCTTDDIGFIEDLLDEVEANYRVDSSRVYVTGFSNGAMMTQRLGCELSHRIAAIAPVSGQPLLGFNCAPLQGDSLPILNIWATRDTVVPGRGNVSEGGAYFTSIHDVMYVMGEYNGCDVEDEAIVDVATSADGIRGWQCVGYDSCDFAVMSCSWNGTHYDFPTTYAEDGHFGLDVVWDFFQKYSKVAVTDDSDDTSGSAIVKVKVWLGAVWALLAMWMTRM